ncbi:MAG: hypothetical protein KDC61_17480 [Saprospiraceae bacterium]|nr:hypothetical protein [Saprospiraceae bacterium]MCB0542780.1 hypothetical protein [Saprospiraceae bacterium]MCB0576351.1 hypothetical protein [Saprospiraceae bacterium]MCB9305959.1 hypothetical protein [Lewinellaceae bacterium]MCB9354737.1 hypothetical protein [Lewinellaceae bacterium]
MQLKNFTTLAAVLLLVQSAASQNLKINIGVNVGMSQLFHNTQFETTPMYNQYRFTKIAVEAHSPPEYEYSWEDFASDYKLRTNFVQPRLGISAHFTYKDWPLLFAVEAMSSPSSYEKMAFGFIAGFGKEFFTYDDNYFFSFLGGYKFVKDNGFGAATIVNSIGHKEAREQAATYFNPEQPLGKKTGNLFTVRGGIGKELGEARMIRVGVEGFGELDLTPKTARQPRMNNFGAQFFLRFKL